MVDFNVLCLNFTSLVHLWRVHWSFIIKLTKVTLTFSGSTGAASSTGGHRFGRSHWSTCTIYCMCTPVQKWPHADLLGKVIHIGFLSARQYSKDGTEHAATVATALYSGTYPGRHGNSKSGRILRRGEARGGAGQWTRWRVFQNPGRSRCIATKCKEVKKKNNNKLRIFQTKIVRSASAICWQGEYLKAR